MPLYDYKCQVCNQEQIDVYHKLADRGPTCCQEPMVKVFHRPSHIDSFDPAMVFEHLAETPMQFRNKRELRHYVRRNNLGMDYVE